MKSMWIELLIKDKHVFESASELLPKVSNKMNPRYLFKAP